MEGLFIQINDPRSYGSKIIEKMSPGCPEHCPKLDAQLLRNNLYSPGGAESVAGSLREYRYQLVSVLSLVSVNNSKKSVKERRRKNPWYAQNL